MLRDKFILFTLKCYFRKSARYSLPNQDICISGKCFLMETSQRISEAHWMPRFLPTILMTWPRLEYETAVQIGLQFTVPLCQPDIGRIGKADTRGLISSSPVLIVPWLEVSVLILSARLLIKKQILALLVCSS